MKSILLILCLDFSLSKVDERFCLMQRPSKGLLANLFEFPSFEIPEKSESEITKKFVANILSDNFAIDALDLKDLGEIIHQVKQKKKIPTNKSIVKKIKLVLIRKLNKKLDILFAKLNN